MLGTTCEAMVRSSASHSVVPAARSPASFSMTGPSAAIMTGVGVMSVMSSGLWIVNSSLSTSTIPGPRQRLVQHVEVAAHGRGLALVGQAEHVLMIQWCETPSPRVKRPSQTAWCGQRLLGQHDGMPWLERHDRRPHLDARGRRTDQGGCRHDVELVGDLRRPDGVQAGLVGPAGVGLELLHLGGVATPVGAHLKTHAHAGLLSVRK